MRVAVFSSKPYDRDSLVRHNLGQHELVFLEPRLTLETSPLAAGFDAVCLFVNDQANAEVLARLAEHGVRCIALRCAGFNNVDVPAAQAAGIRVVRVPTYSPHAVAEHTVALILALNRRIHRAFNRVREGNFSLEGLLGFDLVEKTVGVIGTGRIGAVFAGIMRGFGCRVLAYDLHPSETCQAAGVEYLPLADVLAQADIVSLHCPLVPETRHLIHHQSIAAMKRGGMLINTSRGELIDTPAVIAALKSGQIGFLGLDVYEEEADLFFQDRSNNAIADDVFARLLTFPNVIITGHQAFFTETALSQIATTTLANLTALQAGEPCVNEVHAPLR